MQINTLARAARLPFLLLTPVCILLAYAIAQLTTTAPSLPDTVMILIGALAAHVAVNLLNEYQDFQSGLDLQTVKTPFSGGSGALPDNPEGVRIVLLGAIVSLAIVVWVGIHFISSKGTLVLLPMGFCGVLLIIGYTKYVNRLPWVCLLAPGLGFGILMVLSSVLLLSGGITAQALMLAMIPFFQVNNLLLLNQFPDIDADKKFGRNHFPIAFGTANSARIYRLFALLPFVIITLMILLGSLPWLSLIALVPALPALAVIAAVVEHHDTMVKHPKYLGMNVLVTLSTPALLAVSLLLS